MTQPPVSPDDNVQLDAPTAATLDRLSQSLAAVAEQAVGLRADMTKRDLDQAQRDQDLLKQRQDDRKLTKIILGIGSVLVAAVLALTVIVLVQFNQSKDRGSVTRDLIIDSRDQVMQGVVQSLLCYSSFPPNTQQQAFFKCIQETVNR